MSRFVARRPSFEVMGLQAANSWGSTETGGVGATWLLGMTEPTPSHHSAIDPTLWDANDVAAFLKVSRSWVYHRAESGELPHLRVGGLLRFEPLSIRAYARGENPPRAKRLPLKPPLLQGRTPSR